MGLLEIKEKMATLSSSSPTSSGRSSLDSESTVESSLTPPSSLVPRKKRTFDIAFLTGQSETSSEASTATSNMTSPSTTTTSMEAEDEFSLLQNHHPLHGFKFRTKEAAIADDRSNNGNNINHCGVTPCHNKSSIDIMNHGSYLRGESDSKNIDKEQLLEQGLKYKLFETFSNNNINSSSNSNGNGFRAQNLWIDRNSGSTDCSTSNNKNKNMGNKSRKYKNSTAGNNSKTLTMSDTSKKSQVQSESNLLSLHHNNHNQQMKSEQFASNSGGGGIHLRTTGSISNELVSSSAVYQHINNMSLPSSFTFLPQIARFPIHFTPTSNHHSPHQNNSPLHQHPLTSSSSPFSPPILSEKLNRVHHQNIISAFHHHQQQQAQKIRANGGFSPENLLVNPYAPYASYPSAAAAAILLSQDLNRSVSNHLGLLSPNNISGQQQEQQHISTPIGTCVVGSNACGASSSSSPPSTTSTINTITPTPTSTTTTLLPPSLTSLTLPAQNVCAKCNIGFRMTSDLVYHMRSHHKREADPAKKKREDKLKCSVCLETFRERHHLTRHMTAHQDRAEEMFEESNSKPNISSINMNC